MMNPITRVMGLLSQMGARQTLGVLLVGAILGALTVTQSCAKPSLKVGAMYTVLASDFNPNETLLAEPKSSAPTGQPSAKDELVSDLFSNATPKDGLSDAEEDQKIEAENPYAVMKVLEITPDGVSYRLYSNRYKQRPKTVEPDSLTILPPGSFMGMNFGSDGKPDEIQLRGGLGFAPKALVDAGQAHMTFLYDTPMSEQDRADTQTIDARSNPLVNSDAEPQPTSDSHDPLPRTTPVHHLSPSPWKDKTLP